MPRDNRKQLNSGAKAFVPQNSNLKPTAATWKPDSANSKGKNAPAPSNPPALVKETPSNSEQTAPQPSSQSKKGSEGAFPPPVHTVWVKASNAVRAAPTSNPQQHKFGKQQPTQQHNGNKRDNNNNKDWRKGGQNRPNSGSNDGGGNWRNAKQQGKGRERNRVGNHKGGDRGGDQHNQYEDDKNGKDWGRGKSLPVDLCKPGDGENETQKAVKRIHVEELLALRLSFVAPPLTWGKEEPGPPDNCIWESPTRVQEIDAIVKAPRQYGDVSVTRRNKKQQEVDTAPALEDCKPLEVNEETRWKSNVFKKEDEKEEDSDDVVLKKSLLILNKLSLTKFEKLSDAFIATGIGRNEKCLSGAIKLIVQKAQDEHHFSAMYAALCLKLSKTPLEFDQGGKGKNFKKLLLEQCQKEFEQEIETKIKIAIEGIADQEEIEYHAAIVKKHYLGHMRFIGELYKGDLIKLKIMLYCLQALLPTDSPEESKSNMEVDEEKVECFAKLMTTVGYSLDQQYHKLRSLGKVDSHDQLMECWKKVEIMAEIRKEKGPTVSNRIKFMLQDLIELKQNGWITRREEETAKTIAQIHKEAAKEAKRSSSSGNLRRQHSLEIYKTPKPTVDAEGFQEVVKASGGFNRSYSMGSIRQNSEGKYRLGDNKNSLETGQKVNLVGGAFAAFNNQTNKKASSSKIDKNEDLLPKVEEKGVEEKETKIYKSPEECGDKTKNYLKEFFVGGDTDDAVLSFNELIGAGDEGSVQRGAKVIESGLLMVLEMKKEDVEKFITIALRLFSEKNLEKASIVAGFNDPLEFLSDIAIDAPLATQHMVTITVEFLKVDALTFEFFLNTPDYFRTDGGAAQFACKVLKAIGGAELESVANLEVIEKLMTEDDRASFTSAKELLSV
mmetsp:Transcript_21158/g.29638  ORF Transcript_21158/g.29638 Transcript_21158/m.29638 type:complete len:892 (+) Transcript_21158:386-3061(+)|eukprot:CAMPEP_0184858622 /NCGR_PEP_ID=MMETSP0580-20130426/3701_1 /TAXON_ID=1118495 /ORGANISM="Dactyliosolen fragilissimus" /LENGTH=891 /DNA_ID=CAMNT_0027354867 /DNA_START=303 /DNA_END=2978 /DNA_ORIENTATION=+